MEAELLPLLKEEGIGFYAYNPLMAGAASVFFAPFCILLKPNICQDRLGTKCLHGKVDNRDDISAGILSGKHSTKTEETKSDGGSTEPGGCDARLAREQIPATSPSLASYVGLVIYSGRSFSRSLYDLYRMVRPGLSLCDSRKNLWR